MKVEPKGQTSTKDGTDLEDGSEDLTASTRSKLANVLKALQ